MWSRIAAASQAAFLAGTPAARSTVWHSAIHIIGRIGELSMTTPPVTPSCKVEFFFSLR